MKRLGLCAVLLLGAQLVHAAAPAAASCQRADRDVTFGGRPTRIYIAPAQFTEVVFPEAVAGFLPEVPKGLKSFGQEHGLSAERMFFSTDNAGYQGLAMVHGVSGATYHLEFVGNEGCGDLTVRANTSKPKAATLPSTGEISAGRRLMEYMVTGQAPPSYEREKIDGSLQERLIFRQGSVSFYLSEIWHGVRYTGVVLLAVNTGRVPYRVALENIDYSSPSLRETLGRVSEVTMWPYDFRLAPAPEFASDAVNAANEGLVFIVSDNTQR